MSEIKRQALVVGINRYPFLYGSLTTAVSDAEAIARILELYGDFEVRRLPTDIDEWGNLDPYGHVRQNELQTAITELFCPPIEKRPNTALLYFAGRGLRWEKDGETEGFLATSDSNAIHKNIEPERIKWGISLKWLRQVLQETPVQQQVIWLDSSFSGEFTKVPLVEDGKQRCFIAASQANEDAIAINSRGFLTKVLLTGLNVNQHPNEAITSHILAESIPETLSAEDFTQHPVIANSGKAIVLTAKRRRSRIYSIEEHRLDRLWDDTDGWFSKNHQPMRHTFQTIPRDNDTIANYRQEVQTALGFEMPANWFQQTNSCKHLHESLKSLCGDMFRGHKAAGDRTISVGAAYLIALMAHQEACKSITESLQISSNWDGLEDAPKSWIFPLQNKEDTAASAKALYDLFLNLFESDTQISQVESISLKPPGNRLVIKLTWKANVSKEDNSESLSKWSCKLIEAENIAISDRANNTRAAILRLWRNMLGSQNGFMGPGIVYMEDKKLVVASVQCEGGKVNDN